MTSKSDNGFTAEEQMLGHLVVSAKANQVSTAMSMEEVSDEELALLLEGQAEEKLGVERTRQIKEQLLVQPELFDVWLSMVQDSDCVSAYEPQTEVDTSSTQNKNTGFLAGILDSFSGFFTPQVGFASACSFALALAVGWQLMPPGQAPVTEPASLASSPAATSKAAPNLAADQYAMAPTVMQEALNAPERAAVGFRASSQTEAIVDSALGATFECQQMDSEIDSELCFSNTRNLQHWFYVREPNQLSALPALVEAEKIVSVATKEQFILVEYTQNAEFKLALFDTSVEGSKLSTKRIYQDAAGEDGYFDGLRLGDNGLHYEVNGPGGAEVRQYSYGQP